MKLTLDERSRLDFVLTLRRRWADVLYLAMREQYDNADPHAELRDIMRDLPAYPWSAPDSRIKASAGSSCGA